jgi:hypothetical protein
MQKPEGAATSAPQAAPAPAAPAVTDDVPFEVAPATPTAPVEAPAPAADSGNKAEDILAMIRSRQSAS